MKVQFAIAAAFLALAPVAAIAETQEEQQACMNDAFTICGDAIPDRGKVAACLGQNISRISVACRTVMQRYQKPETTAAASHSTKPLNIKPHAKTKHTASRS